MPTKAYDIPNGPANLGAIFPDIDFSNVASYWIEIQSGGDTIATTPQNDLSGECCANKVRLVFQNSLGRLDAINFCTQVQEHETKSGVFTRPLAYPLVKARHGKNRIGTNATDIWTLVNTDYTEDDRDWIDELLDSPLLWVEIPLQTQEQAPYLLPVIIDDDKFEKIKTEEERYIYELKVNVRLSNERIIIRN